MNPNTKDQKKASGNTDSEEVDRSKQQQSDPQITELKGFVDEDEDIEPKVKGDHAHDHERPD